ncbi:DUF4233 domain-containing protein [Nocardia panacis]|uniref:DUF4233 domain-containing protein n=1 Tax=Nocardia panacis TaxID=2340916 RepID=A0A3A4KB60_9NOCA|nr:DUF4233 domain-containing protein [Nocardia panacis]RJO69848.1 DUF4233 domain-containing protein [Nocardia panacis]
MTESNGEQSNGEQPSPPDPWKGLRGVMAGTLILEAIVVLLALPVVGSVGGGITWLSGGYLVALAVIMILGAGVQRRSRALPFNLALQVLTIAGMFIHVSIGVIGVLFAVVWAFILVLRSDVKKRMEHGLLPGQRIRRSS